MYVACWIITGNIERGSVVIFSVLHENGDRLSKKAKNVSSVVWWEILHHPQCRVELF